MSVHACAGPITVWRPVIACRRRARRPWSRCPGRAGPCPPGTRTVVEQPRRLFRELFEPTATGAATLYWSAVLPPAGPARRPRPVRAGSWPVTIRRRRPSVRPSPRPFPAVPTVSRAVGGLGDAFASARALPCRLRRAAGRRDGVGGKPFEGARHIGVRGAQRVEVDRSHDPVAVTAPFGRSRGPCPGGPLARRRRVGQPFAPVRGDHARSQPGPDHETRDDHRRHAHTHPDTGPGAGLGLVPVVLPMPAGHGNRRFPPGRTASNPGMTSSNQSSWPCAPMVTTPAAGPRSTPAAAGRAGRTGADGTCRRARAGRVRTRPACRGPGRTG